MPPAALGADSGSMYTRGHATPGRGLRWRGDTARVWTTSTDCLCALLCLARSRAYRRPPRLCRCRPSRDDLTPEAACGTPGGTTCWGSRRFSSAEHPCEPTRPTAGGARGRSTLHARPRRASEQSTALVPSSGLETVPTPTTFRADSSRQLRATAKLGEVGAACLGVASECAVGRPAGPWPGGVTESAYLEYACRGPPRCAD